MTTSNTTSMNEGGDNQCCSSSPNDGPSHVAAPAGEEPQQAAAGLSDASKHDNNGEMSGSFSSDVDRTDGDFGVGEDGFGEWTASSDDSFLTADEGYDVR